LTALGLKNEFLYSQSEDRKKTLASFSAGRIPIIVSTNILDEGVDIKDISVLILAFPRKSYRQVLQRIGRGLRKAKNKDFLTVYDFLDEEDKYLKGHYLKRTKFYEKEQFEYKFDTISEDVEGDKKKFEIVCRVLNEELKEQLDNQEI
jgi:superfamily II DNA or RNA helicase